MAVPDFARNITAPFTPCVSHGPIQRDKMVRADALTPQTNAKMANAASAAKNAAHDATKTDKTGAAKDAAKVSAKDSAKASDSTAFDDLLDIVNPLQHIPIVSTIYRAITGDKIGDVEKIAGGALYGGLIGLGSSIADVAFEHLTGKNFGSTMLAMVDGSDDAKPVAIASAQATPQFMPQAVTITPAQIAQTQTLPAQTKLATATAAPKSIIPAQAIAPNFDTAALTQAMQRNGVDSALGLRALAAYQQSLTMTPDQMRKAATGP